MPAQFFLDVRKSILGRPDLRVEAKVLGFLQRFLCESRGMSVVAESIFEIRAGQVELHFLALGHLAPVLRLDSLQAVARGLDPVVDHVLFSCRFVLAVKQQQGDLDEGEVVLLDVQLRASVFADLFELGAGIDALLEVVLHLGHDLGTGGQRQQRQNVSKTLARSYARQL